VTVNGELIADSRNAVEMKEGTYPAAYYLPRVDVRMERLARTLLLLARYGKEGKPARMVPQISQETLAEMVGTTRSRVNFFLNKFRKLGFIDYRGARPIKINSALLSVVLHD
jgi:hypothetical protein